MDEMREVLNRPKFAQRIHALNTSLGELMESLLGIVEVIHDTRIERVIAHDPDDDTILACAVASRAQWIISGDEHLLKLKQYRGHSDPNPKRVLGKVAASPALTAFDACRSMGRRCFCWNSGDGGP